MPLWLILTALVLLEPVSAAAPWGGGSNYALSAWSTKDGLPQNSILDIAQTDDGLLWMATRGGLASFDGQSFETEDVSNSPALGSSRLRQLAVAPTGDLFVGTGDGRVLHRAPGSAWSEVVLPGACREEISGLEFDAQGTLWVGTHCGLYRCDDGESQGELVVQEAIQAVAVGPESGVHFVATSFAARLLDGKRDRITGPVDQLALGARGELFLQRDSSVYRWNSGRKELLPIEVGPVGTIRMTADGRQLWVAGESGGGRWDVVESRWHPLEVADVFEPGRDVVSILVDRDNGVWLGSENHGLMQLSPSPLRALIPEGVPDDRMGSVASTVDGRVFVCGEALWEVVGERLIAHSVPWPSVMAPAASGGLWIVVDHAIERWVDGVRRSVIAREELPPGNGALLEARSGVLWITRGGTLFSWNGDSLERFPLIESSAKEEFNTLYEDRAGLLWIGGLSGLSIWDGSSAKRLGAGRELPVGEVRAFHEADDGAMWVGTYGGGICRIVGDDIQVVDASQGLFENVASALVPDGNGRVVVVGNRAVTSYRMADLAAVADGRASMIWGRAFDSGPGIDIFEGNPVHQQRAAVDLSGMVWIPTLHGVVRFDPSGANERISPPYTRVRCDVKDVEYRSDVGREERFRMPPDDRDVRIQFTAPSYVRPQQVHFRYRLAGREDWHESSSATIIRYDDLPPGEYTFEVEAAIADGEYGPRNDRVSFDVPPRWIEMRAVQVALAVGVTALIVLFALLRLGRARRRAILLEGVVDDRTKELRGEVEERMRAEAQLRKAGEDLEAEVTRRTEQLAQALAKVEGDVKRREKLEGRLRESEKLEAVGRLAGGLAHDFNNILTAVLGEADLAISQLDDDLSAKDREGLASELTQRALRKHLENVRDAGGRAASLTRQLLAYSRQQVMQPDVVDPLKTMENLRTMLGRLIPDNVGLSIEEGAKSRPILIDPGQLEQVIVNLVVNAAEALSGGGQISLDSAHSITEDGREATTISVSDDGVGMSRESLARVFEPFFSTKGNERGLGLASVQGIVLQSGGTLDVQSELGEGTRFRVTFPKTDQRPQAPTPGKRGADGSGITVLLTDDQDDVRRVTRMMLERSGVRVIEAPTPSEAIDLAAKYADELNVLVTDVVMPNMSGRELSHEVRRLCPDIKVLFVSGYFAEELSARELLASEANFLMKPYDTRTLVSRIAELVGAESSADR